MQLKHDFCLYALVFFLGHAVWGCYRSHELSIPPVSDPWRPDVAERFDLDQCVPTSAPISLGDASDFAPLLGGVAIASTATDQGVVVATTPRSTIASEDDADIDVVVWFASLSGAAVQSARLEGCGVVLDVAWNRARDRVLVVASECWGVLDSMGRVLGDPIRDWWPSELRGGSLRGANVANRDGNFVVVAAVRREEWLTKIALMPALEHAPIRWATELWSGADQSRLSIVRHESGALAYLKQDVTDPENPFERRMRRYFRLEENLSLTEVATIASEGSGWRVLADADPGFKVDFLDSSSLPLSTSWTDVLLERIQDGVVTTTTLIESGAVPSAGADHRPIGEDRILLAADRWMGTPGISVASYRLSEAHFEGSPLLLDEARGIPQLLRTQCGFVAVWMRTEEDRDLLGEAIRAALGTRPQPWNGQLFTQRFECCE